MKRVILEEEDYNAQTEIPNRIVIDIDDAEVENFIKSKEKKFKKLKQEVKEK